MKILHATHRATGPELVTKIPLTKGLPYKIYTLRAICVEDIKAGDKFNAFGGFSVTFDGKFPNGTWCNYPVMSCCFIQIADDMPSQPFIGDAANPVLNTIDPPSGQNIDRPLIHHYRTRMQGEWEADCDYERKWFLFCGYAASALCTLGPLEVLTVDQNYGKAWVDQYRDYCPEGIENAD